MSDRAALAAFAGPATLPARRRLIAATLALLLAACAGVPAPIVQRLPDAPDPARPRPAAVDAPPAYRDALARWRSPQEVADWIGARFSYDAQRALALSETSRQAGLAPAVRAPEAFFDDPRGVCIDLAHFAVGTLRAVAPQLHARYLLIEFEPVRIAGHTLRQHWIAAVEIDGALHFLADSWRPGHVAGPYADLPSFVDDYARVRQRPIVGARLLEGHQRRPKERAPKARREEHAARAGAGVV